MASRRPWDEPRSRNRVEIPARLWAESERRHPVGVQLRIPGPGIRLAPARSRQRVRWGRPRRRLLCGSCLRSRESRPFDHADSSVCSMRQRGRIRTQRLPLPPVAGRALFRHRRKPILPQDRADLFRRSTGNGLPWNRDRTSRSLLSNRSSVFTTNSCPAMTPAKQTRDSSRIGAGRAHKYGALRSTLAVYSGRDRPSSSAHRSILEIQSRSERESLQRTTHTDWRCGTAPVRRPETSGRARVARASK